MSEQAKDEAAEQSPGLAGSLAGRSAAVTLALAKKSGSNGVSVAKAILERVDSLKGRLIPDSVRVAV